MDPRGSRQGGKNFTAPIGADGKEIALQSYTNCDIMSYKRKVEIFSQIARHLTALVYLIAELVIGVKIEKL